MTFDLFVQIRMKIKNFVIPKACQITGLFYFSNKIEYACTNKEKSRIELFRPNLKKYSGRH
ncbi:hypothetical protein CSTERTH_03155 [Thermoclostridium stercorarium subsp. thermolacticum DSM 2910]|uniref:Uncharacterized protein n=2 Tax=Thermoclostridium stercorarium TaxID=1510 RepID=A0A1B1YIT2_THEST|nr:hypothetical protein CSTERTH_03155 [Thermoclostridium stercorarium subsp. thermolacticum DSM 2910]ANX00654.1 hypothetical protein CSTERLE_03130 [Thermoclostridium stercorarium subsp. leptospartum DSM 9219]